MLLRKIEPALNVFMHEFGITIVEHTNAVQINFQKISILDENDIVCSLGSQRPQR